MCSAFHIPIPATVTHIAPSHELLALVSLVVHGQVLELEQSNAWATQTVTELEPIVRQKNDKLKVGAREARQKV